MARVIPLSVGNVGPVVDKATIGTLPLLDSDKNKSRSVGKLDQLWQFLLGGKGGHQVNSLKSTRLEPDSLVLRQVTPEHVKQRLAIGNNDFTLAHFAIPSQLDLQGTLFSGKVVDLAPAQIALSVVYLDGRSGSTATPKLVELDRDRAWSVGAEARLFSGQFQLHGEYAQTYHHSDPLAGMAIQNGGAYKLGLSYQPLQTVTFFDSPVNWTMGVKHRWVSRLFQSPAELSGEQEVSLMEGFTHLGWRGLVLDASVIQRPNNNIAQIRGQYQFPKFGLLWWLGTSRIAMNFSKENNEVSEQHTSVAEFNADFSYQSWGWNLSHRMNWCEDRIMKTSPGYLGVTIAKANFRLFSNSLSLAPVIRYQHSSANFDISRQLSVGVGTHAIFIPEWLDGQIRVDAQQGWNRESLRQHTYSTSGGLNWWLTPRKSRDPAVHLFLEARYQAVVDQVNDFTDDYRVFLGVALN